MIYDSSLNNIWKSAGDGTSRYVLHAVKIDAEKKAAVACDGHALAAVSIATMLEPDEKSFLAPVDALKAAASLYSQQKRLTEKVRKKVYIRQVEDAVVVSLQGSKRSLSFDLVEFQYPAWEAVCPNLHGYSQVAMLDVKTLSALVASLNNPSKQWDGKIALYAKDSTSAIVLATAGDFRPSYAILMPIRHEFSKPTKFWEAK